jgi:hypothetical protein
VAGMNGAGPGHWRALVDAEELAWVVLQAANRTQAKGSTVRLVMPRAPEVAFEMGMEDLGDEPFLTAEEFLVERGYLVPDDLGLTRGSYTITREGFRWLERGPVTAWALGRSRETEARPGW